MARVKKTSFRETYSHKRGWGTEYWIENIPDYCGKLLVIDPNKRCSLHFHMNKLETMYLESGNATILFIDPYTGEEYVVDMVAGDSIKIPRGQVHQIIASKYGCEIFEFSTMHDENDSYRVKKGD